MKTEKAKNTWDLRFASEEYIYGKKPNEFFKKEIDALIPGKLLLPAEGEGRNAVYAASLGWEVTAFDNSIEGKKKALLLSEEQDVKIEYLLKDYDKFEAEENSYDLIACIYAHHIHRQKNHQKLIRFLKPGGKIILEGFAKEQLQYGTGGPPSVELLFSKEELISDFKTLISLEVKQKIKHLSEGNHHLGDSSVIQLTGIKGHTLNNM